MVSELTSPRRRRLRAALRKAHGDMCHWCSKRMIFETAFRDHDLYATVEHVIARCEGGTHDWENLRLAHKQCNNGRPHAAPASGGGAARVRPDLHPETIRLGIRRTSRFNAARRGNAPPETTGLD